MVVSTRFVSLILWDLVLSMAAASLAVGQGIRPAVLTIEMENVVQYQESFSSQAKNGTSTAQESPVSRATYAPGYFIADIVAVNGAKAKGTTVARNVFLMLNPNPSGSQAIADVTRFEHMDIVLEIQQADGSPVGALVLTGLTGGSGPLGGPKSAPLGNFAVTGGTGAYYGARGQAATVSNAHRMTSTLENPINRRTFGGGKWQLVVQLLPASSPEIAMNGTSPAIVHADDFTLVTAARPARAGEMLVVFASGLGPTRPGVDPGQPFPSSPAQVAALPVEVLVNGRSAEVTYAGGYPDSIDRYQINFRVPEQTAPGSVAIQVTSAWIAGTEARIPIQ